MNWSNQTKHIHLLSWMLFSSSFTIALVRRCSSTSVPPVLDSLHKCIIFDKLYYFSCKRSSMSILAPRVSAQTQSSSKQTRPALLHQYCSCAEVWPTTQTNAAVFGIKDLQVRSIFHGETGKKEKWSHFKKNQ